MTTGLTFYGLNNRIGDTVAAFVAGLDCGDYVVAANGSVTVPYQSDPDGLFTAAYVINLANNPPGTIADWGWGNTAVTVEISSVAYTIPVAIGAVYTSQGQVVRPDSMHPGQNGPGLGKTRRIHMFAAKLVNAVTNSLSFGSDFSTTLIPVKLPGNGKTAYNQTTLFKGVYWAPLKCDYDFDGMVSWQIERPFPCTVASVSSFVEMADR